MNRIVVALLLLISSVVWAEDPPAPSAGDDTEQVTEADAGQSGVETVVPTEDGLAPSPEQPLPDEVRSGPEPLRAAPTGRSHLESTVFRRKVPIYYDAAGRRDPFRALIVDEKKEGEIETDLLRLEDAILTGVVWSNDHYLAMVRDKDGLTFFLREGDPIYSGRVLSIEQSQVSFEVTEFGDYERITLKIKR